MATVRKPSSLYVSLRIWQIIPLMMLLLLYSLLKLTLILPSNFFRWGLLSLSGVDFATVHFPAYSVFSRAFSISVSSLPTGPVTGSSGHLFILSRMFYVSTPPWLVSMMDSMGTRISMAIISSSTEGRLLRWFCCSSS